MNCRSQVLGSLALLACGLGFLSGCQKKPAPEEVAPIDQVGPSPVGTRQEVLHKSFTVGTTVAFPFEIPAHAATPYLRGRFKSYVGQTALPPNEHRADVDFLLFNEQQYADFSAGNPSESIFSADASQEQTVDVSLPPSLNQSAKYYLVFRNTPGGDAQKTVQADLTVDF
jgi:hypothetical protein